MRTIYLIGTSHTFQLPSNELHSNEIVKFQQMIQTFCTSYRVSGIAEEMNQQVLDGKLIAKSVAQKVCELLGIYHQFSDPSQKERYELGIRQDNDIRVDHVFKKSTPAEIEADVLARGSVPSDRIREQFWLRKIQELNVWPLLFICGASHFTEFAKLLRSNSIDVIEIHRDWTPEI